jgi:hypothetical protein
MAETRKSRRNGRRRRSGSQNNERLPQGANHAPSMLREQTRRGVDATGVWAELNQRVMQDFADLWLRGARESTRALTQMQEANLEAWREAQSAALRWLRRGVSGIADAGSTGASRAA